MQRAGDQFRLNVQLIDGTTDEHLWAQTYDRELTTANLFDVQADIATAIESIKKGAFSYIPKPLSPDELLNVTRGAIDKDRQ